MKSFLFVAWISVSLMANPLCTSVSGACQDREIDLDSELIQSEQQRIEVIHQASAASIGVFGPDGNGGGSGVVISPDGFALTNFHVVQGNGAFMKCSMPDGGFYDAVIVGIDPVGDVAVIKLLGRDDFPYAKLGDSDELKQGQWCFAVGNPFLLATDFQPTVTWGLVSGIHRYQYPSGTLLEYADCIQTDAAINPGNSGGPLFNDRGELVGVNGRGSFEKRGRINVGVGYAISINQIKLFMNHLLSGRLVDHATLGATVATNDRGQVRISNILESSDAFRRGLRFDDEVILFGRREIQNVNQFKNELGIYPKGYRVPLSFLRDGKRFDIQVRLTGVHAAEKLIELIEGASEPESEMPEPGEEQPNPVPARQSITADQRPPDNKYAHLFEARSGFANFYFNRRFRDEVWNRFLSNGNLALEPSTWRMSGNDSDGNPFQLVLSPTQSGLQYGTETHLYDADQPLEPQLNSAMSKVLLALRLYQRLVEKGPANYGEVLYFGRLPTPEDQQLADVLIGTFDVTESNFFFASESGNLVAMEMYSNVGEDPVELTFSGYQRRGQVSVPSALTIRLGNAAPLQLAIEQLEFLQDGKTVE